MPGTSGLTRLLFARSYGLGSSYAVVYCTSLYDAQGVQ